MYCRCMGEWQHYIVVAFKLEIKDYEDVSPCLATCTCVAMTHMHHGSTHQVLHYVFH